jgi:hypothetical protein
MYWSYEGHNLDGKPSEKMTAKTDVWHVGQMMWNLVMNLPGKTGFNMEPFTQKISEEGHFIEELLNQGYKYDLISKKDEFLSGEMPLEAPSMYSDVAKDTIFMRMDYHPEKRWSFAQLKGVTKNWAGKDPPLGPRAHGNLMVSVSETMDDFRLGATYNDGTKRRR